MSDLAFATGNDNKFYEADKICNEYGFGLKQANVAVDEIQHHDPNEIAKAKVRAVYDALRQPVVINDSSWSIAALGGFPGGYMKDVARWLGEDDFLALMKHKTDRSIQLTETVAYFDGEELKVFTYDRQGLFVDTPKGESETRFNKVVVMEGDDMTMAEKLSQSNRTVDASNYQHWLAFAEWYAKERTE